MNLAVTAAFAGIRYACMVPVFGPAGSHPAFVCGCHTPFMLVVTVSFDAMLNC